MRPIALLPLVVALALPAAARGQRPDFTGTYVLVRDSTPPGTTGPRSADRPPDRVIIVHREPSFTYQLVYRGETGADTVTATHTTDGRETVFETPRSRLVSALAWAGDTLVLVNRQTRGTAVSTSAVRFLLRDGGRTLRIADRREGGGQRTESVRTYRRGP